jgi:hypothetical protein
MIGSRVDGIAFALFLFMRHLMAITRCKKPGVSVTLFSFRGFFCGEEVIQLQLQSSLGVNWERGEDYLLRVEVHRIMEGVLEGRILQAKKLTEIMSQG